MDYGSITLNIVKLLEQKGISKNRICKDLDIARPNFNRYCKNKFQRIDVNLISKLCFYFECSVEDLIEYHPPKNKDEYE